MYFAISCKWFLWFILLFNSAEVYIVYLSIFWVESLYFSYQNNKNVFLQTTELELILGTNFVKSTLSVGLFKDNSCWEYCRHRLLNATWMHQCSKCTWAQLFWYFWIINVQNRKRKAQPGVTIDALKQILNYLVMFMTSKTVPPSILNIKSSKQKIELSYATVSIM